MNISICCSLNRLPPSSALDPSSSPSLLTRTNFPRKPNDEKASSTSWSKRMTVLATTMVLTLEVGDIISNNINGSYYYTMASENAMEFDIPKNKKENNNVPRWSDKRSCPPWNMNSIETIVPENLPRPFFHRKWEKVSYDSNIVSPKSAPPIEFIVIKPRKGCFSL